MLRMPRPPRSRLIGLPNWAAPGLPPPIATRLVKLVTGIIKARWLPPLAPLLMVGARKAR